MAHHRDDDGGPVRPPGLHATSGPSASDDPAYDQVKVYTITDRPVYRPGSPVRFKFWVARARYDQPDASEFAGKSSPSRSRIPRGTRSSRRTSRPTPSAASTARSSCPPTRRSGSIRSSSPNRGGGSFRVEEYKKPEFEVNVEAPKTPVMLGEKVSATIKAKYYFGGPVAEAKVKYKITRTTADARWYPAARWDWLFGSGYWWFAADSSWYPGWSRWGMLRPRGLVVGTVPGASRSGGRGRAADPARWDAPHRDRHRDRQGGPPGPGPSLRDHGRDHRPVPPHDRRHRDRAGRAQALHASIPGSIAATTARATRSRPRSAPRPSTTSRSPARGRSSCSRSPTTPSESRSRRPSRAGTSRSTPTARPARRSRHRPRASTGSRRRSTTARAT